LSIWPGQRASPSIPNPMSTVGICRPLRWKCPNYMDNRHLVQGEGLHSSSQCRVRDFDCASVEHLRARRLLLSLAKKYFGWRVTFANFPCT
jgi:hypothetical protein